LHDVHVVAVPLQVRQLVSHGKHEVPLRKKPAAQAVQLVVVFTHVVHEASHLSSQVFFTRFKNLPGLQEVQVVADPEQVRQSAPHGLQTVPFNQ